MAEIGTVLGGRYRLVELLGQGGMATIFRSHDNQLGRDVAVKLLRPEYGRDPDFGSRFRQEAQNAASLNHPNIVSVYDYGQDTAGPFIVMELVEGEDLSSIIRRSGALPPRQAARIVADTARALEAAHARGIVHRDVKPGNIMIGRDGRVKVTDFGIARAVAEAQMTLPGTTLGSVHYFSPEQARGEQATASSDVFALGIVLYELLTGHRPWEGDTAAAVAMARLAGPVPDPSTRRAGIPPELTAITRRALAMEPDERWASAGSFGGALEAYLAGQPIPELGAIGGATIVGAGAAAAATARPNPAAIPYSDDAYAGRRVARGRTPPTGAEGFDVGERYARRDTRRVIEEDEDREGTSPMIWVAGLVAIAILAIAGFLVFQLLSGGTEPPDEGPVVVPNFVGRTFAEAEDLAAESGLTVVQAATEVDPANEGKVLRQEPVAGASIEAGGEVRLTIAVGEATAAVPDLRNKTPQEAFQLLATAGLQLGNVTQEFDPVVPAGLIIRQEPAAGIVVNQGTSVNYVVSTGPSPSPSPSPTPTPTPEPTPTPPPPPTPTPAPALLTVGDYVCMSVADARDQIEADGFTVAGVIPPSADEDWIVSGQAPEAESERPEGFPVTITAQEEAPEGCN
ncbi:MAG TPA: Stk1 family PASTA domain-containing Ser/Thr kinase [Candidatus Limnocylindrales bacterium]|nr:Stk1 family PASTA domain-containing Ser/Thr kinase [Candidatus Limnocylindrales bacterium]